MRTDQWGWARNTKQTGVAFLLFQKLGAAEDKHRLASSVYHMDVLAYLTQYLAVRSRSF